MDTVIFLVLGLAGILVYFAPALVANRRHRHARAITMLNLLLGWTFIGWIAAMVWACMDQPAGD